MSYFVGRLQPTLCPFCGSREIQLGVESEIANSYRCDNCRLYFSVTYAADPPSYTLTTTTYPGEDGRAQT